MHSPNLLVRIDSKHHFRYVEDKVPVAYALVSFQDRAGKPNGLIAMYELIVADEYNAQLSIDVGSAMDHIQACEAIAAHVRACLLPKLGYVGDSFKVSFKGKGINTVDIKWREGVSQVNPPMGRQDL